MGAPDDPVEGSNVTLICRILFPGIRYPTPPEWEYQINSSAVMQTINETNPPAGDKSHLFIGKIKMKHLSPAGIQIETEGEKRKHDSGGFKLNYYVSKLHLFNVSKTTHTTFQCKANQFQDAIAKAISFRIKGIEKTK